MEQFLMTPSAGKRLIGKAVAADQAILDTARNRTVVIIAGTTNGYVAEELLNSLGITEAFSRQRFFRGITLPPGKPRTESGRVPDQSAFSGDVVITKGEWRKGLTIQDVADELVEGDIVLKGANAVNLETRQAAIYIGDRKGGTVGAAVQTVVGRRVRLILAVGLEKRILEDPWTVALAVNAPGSTGPRLYPVPGEIVTELDAVAALTGARARLIAAGGVGGAEGCIWLGVSGDERQVETARELLKSVAKEPPFEG